MGIKLMDAPEDRRCSVCGGPLRRGRNVLGVCTVNERCRAAWRELRLESKRAREQDRRRERAPVRPTEEQVTEATRRQYEAMVADRRARGVPEGGYPFWHLDDVWAVRELKAEH
jgi:hypothetical protein